MIAKAAEALVFEEEMAVFNGDGRRALAFAGFCVSHRME